MQSENRNAPRMLAFRGAFLFSDYFGLLNVRKRKTIYWEHFGLAADGEYATKALKKLDLYERNGFRIGDNLLFTMEYEEASLDVKRIEEMIDYHLR